MSEKKLVIHDSEGKIVPDICGKAIELINKDTSFPTKVSFAKIVIEPNQKSQFHYHNFTEEIYYILSGTGKMIIDDQSFDVVPGHTILIPIGLKHQIINTCRKNLIFVCADAPVFDPNDIFNT